LRRGYSPPLQRYTHIGQMRYWPLMFRGASFAFSLTANPLVTALRSIPPSKRQALRNYNGIPPPVPCDGFCRRPVTEHETHKLGSSSIPGRNCTVTLFVTVLFYAFAASHRRMALASPHGVFEFSRSTSICATSALIGKPLASAASLSASQNSGSKLIDVWCPAMVMLRFTGGW
jgi:hypothetical protein